MSLLYLGHHSLTPHTSAVVPLSTYITLLIQFLRLIRPKQWIKNLFVFAPLVFAEELFHLDTVVDSVLAFLSFCLAASCVYIINDITDRDADRSHPEKKTRPIASGSVTIPMAGFLLGLLVIATFLLASGARPGFRLILASNIEMNVAYSIKLKEVVLLDVFVIATGFMLRVLGGAYAIDVSVSTWIVLCTLFISLFLGFAKRRGELVQSAETGENSRRKVLSLYRVEYLDQMLTISAAGAVISYALYTVAPRTIEVFGTDKMIYTTVFVVYGVLRYLYLIHMTSSTDNPTNAVLRDPTLLVNIFVWVLVCIAFIYR